MEKFKVMTIFGTRPEAIKMAPLVDGLKKHIAVTYKIYHVRRALSMR